MEKPLKIMFFTDKSHVFAMGIILIFVLSNHKLINKVMSRLNKISKKVVGLVSVMIIAPTLTVKAQDKKDVAEKDSIISTFKMSAQIRPRFEVRDGQFRPLSSNEQAAVLVSDRLRLTMDYAYKKDVLTLRIAPQVVSIWGQANLVQGPENVGNKFALHETWAKLKISPSWHTQIGRQVISLDDERVFGALDWAQGARVHDAVSIHFKKKKFEVKGFFAYNQNYKTLYGNNINNLTGNNYNSTDAAPHKLMQTVWASLPAGENSKVTLLATNIGFQQATPTNAKAPEYYSQTFGANYFWSIPTGILQGQVAGYFQTGRNSVGAKVEAYTATVNMKYYLFNANLRLTLGSDLISGNDVGKTQTKNSMFNPYFTTGHKFYGFMDYFHAGNGHKSAGISDNYLKMEWVKRVGKKQNWLSLALDLHQFFTPNKVMDLNKSYKSNLGQEVDLTIKYEINEFVTLLGGYSFYATNETIKFLKGVPNARFAQQWAWMSVNITPNLFEVKTPYKQRPPHRDGVVEVRKIPF